MTFVDVESMVLQFLNTETGVPVHTTVPAERPARFIRMWRFYLAVCEAAFEPRSTGSWTAHR